MHLADSQARMIVLLEITQLYVFSKRKHEVNESKIWKLQWQNSRA